MSENDNKNALRNMKLNYFFTTLFVYIGFFVGLFFLSVIILTIVQAHPYVYLLIAVILLLVDILFTDRLVNHLWKDRWLRS